MRKETVLASAQFDPRLPGYFMLQAVCVLLMGVLTIPLIPLWLLFGRAVHKKQYESFSCDLTERSLNLRRGFLFKVQKNIPLDKITDLAVNEGPVLRYLGLCSLKIETAGGGQGSTMGQALLPGVVDAVAFRDRVLNQRDLVVVGAGVSGAADGTGDDGVLVEIRDTLLRIEKALEDR